MATITTHTLNSVLGTHAAGVGVTLVRIERSGARVVVFDEVTDSGGRLAQSVVVSRAHADADHELIFQSGRYFEGQALPRPARQILKEVVIRFSMPDPDASYHIPLMLAPNSYSAWWSS